jgi:hypothetical protein
MTKGDLTIMSKKWSEPKGKEKTHKFDLDYIYDKKGENIKIVTKHYGFKTFVEMKRYIDDNNLKTKGWGYNYKLKYYYITE